MLRLSGGQVESLFDEVLPIEVRQLPADLAALDEQLTDRALLAPVKRAWDAAARSFGRPSVPIDRFVRLMVVKHRSGWGYETLVREVSDSLHLRRFCLLALSERVPDESTIASSPAGSGPTSWRRSVGTSSPWRRALRVSSGSSCAPPGWTRRSSRLTCAI